MECRQCQTHFELTAQDQALLKRFAVPNPTLCPACRLRRRYNLRNERVLYNRTCDLTGKPIVAIFPADSPYTIYSQEAWWSDGWDQFKFGREVDFTQPVFKQMKALQLQQPRMALLAKDSENSAYTNHSAYNKNCYLGFSVVNGEHVYYGFMNFQCSFLVDCNYMYEQSELCYQNFYGHRNYGCVYATLCRGCTNVWFSFDLSGCEDCFLSYNLRNKKFCFMNQQLTEAEYRAKVAEFKNMSYTQQQQLVQQWQAMIATQAIHQAVNQVNVSESTGNFLAKTHAVHEGYYSSEAEQCAYLFQGEKVKDCMDVSSIAPGEFVYEGTALINTNHSRFVNYSYDNTFIDYCDHVFNSQNLFACVGLNKQKFCILNKQYTEPEYNRLKEKVIDYMKTTGEYGEFFPLWYSPFGYNETVAHQLYPLTKPEAVALGANWNDALDQRPTVANGIPANQLLERITEVADDILKQVIICEQSGRPFKIQPEELRIYRQLGIPLPHLHPDVRYTERSKQRMAPKLYQRECARCHKGVTSTFAPNRTEVVYCTACYHETVLA